MATCLHGFEPGQCLICQTLGPAQTASGRPRTATRADRRGTPAGSLPSGGPVEVVAGGPGGGRPKVFSHVLVAVVLVVVAIIAFWAVAGIVIALLRLLEIVLVAAVAGVIGYRLGRARGHRDRDS